MSKPIVALQMDPLSTIRVESDSTFALGLEAQNRGCQLFVYTPTDLSYTQGRIVARGCWVTFHDHQKDYYTLGAEVLLDLEEAQYVLMRQDPPFDMNYIAATHLLDLLPSTTCVINNPAGVRNAPEKLLVTKFAELTPPTLISWDRALIDDFIHSHETVILKPIFDYGGNGILIIQANDPNLTGILEMYRNIYNTAPIFQKYIPDVIQGDKRVILINGEAVGIVMRVPPKGQIRSNLRLGGIAQPCEFSQRDREISTHIGPTLRERGLYLAGIDIIGDYLTEINVTSPTGLRVINQLYDLDLAKTFWDGLVS